MVKTRDQCEEEMWPPTQRTEFKERVTVTGLLGSNPLPITKTCISSNKMTNLMKKKIPFWKKKYTQDFMTKPYKGISKKETTCCWHINKMCISVGILFHAMNRWIRFSQVKALRSFSFLPENRTQIRTLLIRTQARPY